MIRMQADGKLKVQYIPIHTSYLEEVVRFSATKDGLR